MRNMCCRKIFVKVAVVISLIIAILGITLPASGLRYLTVLINFFNLMLPSLAVAALVNYLLKSLCCDGKSGSNNTTAGKGCCDKTDKGSEACDVVSIRE